MKKEIEKYQRKLKLSGSIMEIYPTIQESSHEEFLCILLKELYEDREQKRRIRNLNNAGFQVIKSLEGYDFSQVVFPDTMQPHLLEELSFLEKKENLILYEAVGTGKTHLSVALGVKAISQGKTAVFYRVHDLINQLESQDPKKIDKPELFTQYTKKPCKLLNCHI